MEPKNVNNREKAIKLEVKDKMPDEMTPEEQEAFLNEPITRKEAMNFIDGYMQNHVLPQLEQQISAQYNSAYAMVHVLESLIIHSGLCTLEELQKCYEDYIKLQEQKENNKEQQ